MSSYGSSSRWNSYNYEPDDYDHVPILNAVEKKAKTITMQDIFEVLKDRKVIMLDTLLYELLVLRADSHFIDKRLESLLLPIIDHISHYTSNLQAKHIEELKDTKVAYKITVQRLFRDPQIYTNFFKQFSSFEKYLETKFNVYNKSKNKFFKFKVLKPSNIVICYEKINEENIVKEETIKEKEFPAPGGIDWW